MLPSLFRYSCTVVATSSSSVPTGSMHCVGVCVDCAIWKNSEFGKQNKRFALTRYICTQRARAGFAEMKAPLFNV